MPVNPSWLLINPRSRAIAAAVLLLPALLVLKIQLSAPGPEVLAEENLSATVSALEPKGTVGHSQIYSLGFTLEDGREIELQLREPVPQIGDVVWLTQQTLEHNKKTEQVYLFQRSRWELGE